ncbi:hypothetical protein L6303_02500 [archaeon]|nr:hypothetical protein [archaeon]
MNCEPSSTIKNGMNNDFVERWANFVKTHPRAVWKKQVGPLIDAQIILAERFYARLSKTPGGAAKLRKLRVIRRRTV